VSNLTPIPDSGDRPLLRCSRPANLYPARDAPNEPRGLVPRCPIRGMAPRGPTGHLSSRCV